MEKVYVKSGSKCGILDHLPTSGRIGPAGRSSEESPGSDWRSNFSPHFPQDTSAIESVQRAEHPGSSLLSHVKRVPGGTRNCPSISSNSRELFGAEGRTQRRICHPDNCSVPVSLETPSVAVGVASNILITTGATSLPKP